MSCQYPTPIAGLAVQQSVKEGQVIGPWTGIGVMCVYAVAALGIGYWQLTRRDA